MRPFGVRDGAAKAAGLRLRRGQNPLSLFGCAEKRKRFLMVSREKTLAAAFQAPPETPFPACLRGFWPGGRRGLCLLYPLLTPTKVRVPSGCTALLFCCRTPAFKETLAPFFRCPPEYSSKTEAGAIRNHPFRQSFRNCQCAAAKEKQRASGSIPSF